MYDAVCSQTFYRCIHTNQRPPVWFFCYPHQKGAHKQSDFHCVNQWQCFHLQDWIQPVASFMQIANSMCRTRTRGLIWSLCVQCRSATEDLVDPFMIGLTQLTVILEMFTLYKMLRYGKWSLQKMSGNVFNCLCRAFQETNWAPKDPAGSQGQGNTLLFIGHFLRSDWSCLAFRCQMSQNSQNKSSLWKSGFLKGDTSHSPQRSLIEALQ